MRELFPTSPPETYRSAVRLTEKAIRQVLETGNADWSVAQSTGQQIYALKLDEQQRSETASQAGVAEEY